MERDANTGERTEKPEREPRPPASLINDLVRLVGKLGEHPVFKQSEIGLTEWCFLRMVSESQGLGGGRIAGRLGITPQRSAQIVSTLVGAKYVTSSQSADDARRRILTITDHGRATAEAIDKEITELLQRVFPDVPKAVGSMGRSARKLLKAISPSDKKTK